MPHSDPAYEQLGKVLFEARQEAGFTLRELAARLQWPHSVLGKIELAERHINVIEFIELARALEIEPAKLLKRIVKATGL